MCQDVWPGPESSLTRTPIHPRQDRRNPTDVGIDEPVPLPGLPYRALLWARPLQGFPLLQLLLCYLCLPWLAWSPFPLAGGSSNLRVPGRLMPLSRLWLSLSRFQGYVSGLRVMRPSAGVPILVRTHALHNASPAGGVTDPGEAEGVCGCAPAAGPRLFVGPHDAVGGWGDPICPIHLLCPIRGGFVGWVSGIALIQLPSTTSSCCF